MQAKNELKERKGEAGRESKEERRESIQVR